MQRQFETCAGIARDYAQIPAMLARQFAGDREADAGAGDAIGDPVAEAMERHEYLLAMFARYAGAAVRHGDRRGVTTWRLAMSIQRPRRVFSTWRSGCRDLLTASRSKARCRQRRHRAYLDALARATPEVIQHERDAWSMLLAKHAVPAGVLASAKVSTCDEAGQAWLWRR